MPEQATPLWVRDNKYDLHGMNVMLAAEKMCKSPHWLDALNQARGHCKVSERHECNLAAKLWMRTMASEGKCGDAGIRFRIRDMEGWHCSGRGGPRYGVTVSARRSTSRGSLLMTMLHEVAHVVHLSDMKTPVVNGVRRPHGMDFNLIMCHMAKMMWGFPLTPAQAGYSTGKGYSPSRRLEEWLHSEIKAESPRILRWLNGTKHKQGDE